MSQISGPLGHKAAKQERLTMALNSRPRGRKKLFKNELWYAAAYPKMSAIRKTPSQGQEETRAPALSPD